ncbi:hypothetical protein E2C01_071085 [Portunus trituberculatus]|uniref:Uncharacterized protein n=1 Tax=Portunus trituberculatus TaxID=210409 RepID=A0A5B7HUG3_PORTR|nr:hypothetical protein [Portunus trituberculatus]
METRQKSSKEHEPKRNLKNKAKNRQNLDRNPKETHLNLSKKTVKRQGTRKSPYEAQGNDVCSRAIPPPGTSVEATGNSSVAPRISPKHREASEARFFSLFTLFTVLCKAACTVYQEVVEGETGKGAALVPQLCSSPQASTSASCFFFEMKDEKGSKVEGCLSGSLSFTLPFHAEL